MNKKSASILIIFFAGLISACSGDGITSTVSLETEVSETEAVESFPLRSLNICIAEEPDSLFLYGESVAKATSVLQAIYDGPFDSLDFDLQPVILVKTPSLADDDAKFIAVQVNSGDLIVDSTGEINSLGNGVSYFPAGCKDLKCAEIYSSENKISVEMDQLTVIFTLVEGISWSDGTLLTAGDSVYSFEVARVLKNGNMEELINKTDSYKSLDSNSVEWRGLPGFRDANYRSNFFTPLPRHVWENIPVTELPVADISSRNPIGYGAYTVSEWQIGENIHLIKNQYYFRASEQLPYFDEITFFFIGENEADAIAALVTGKCDMLDESIVINYQSDDVQTLISDGVLSLASAPGRSWEHLDFGIVPISYDEIYNVAQGDRPNYFGDVRTRQAIAYCLDREAITEQVTMGLGERLNSYILEDNPLFNAELEEYRRDVNLARNLLAQVGWVPGDNGILISTAVDGIPNGTKFEIGYFTTDSTIHLAVAQIIGSNLMDCGISVNIASGNPAELFAVGPEGLLFGRQFDLAQFAWPFEMQPSCYLYFGDAVPGANIDQFPYSWGGWNLTGWQDNDFDAACSVALAAIPGEQEYTSAHYLAQQIFSIALPVIPLYSPPIVVLVRANICNLEPNVNENILWNIEEIKNGEAC